MTTLALLPDCLCRGPAGADGRYPCASTCLLLPPGGRVTEATCRQCGGCSERCRPGPAKSANGHVRPAPPAPAPVPDRKDRGQWPVLARTLAWTLSNDADAGLGDTIHRHLAKLGADALTRLYKEIVGKDCGCGDRRQKLNALYAYK